MNKTATMMINSREVGMQKALEATEKLAEDSGLSKKEILHLRLLAEELLGMLRSIAGDVEADYWLEYQDKSFALYMKSEIKLTEQMRRQLLSASSSGENEAARGFMGKLRVMIAEKLFFNMPGSSLLSLGVMSMASPSAQAAAGGAYVWSMEKYMNSVKNEKDENAAASEAWDELEKSIVANIADEVSVRIVGHNVEIAVSKAF